MNTVKSFWIGMAAFTAAGGGAYYFAKKQIDADRVEKFQRDQKRRRQMEELEYNSRLATKSAPKPSSEQPEPAPTQHSLSSEEAKILGDSKYEAKEPFRSRKGDRFS